MQETLLRAWRAARRLRPARASLRTWLYRIATNACLTALESPPPRPLPSVSASGSTTRTRRSCPASRCRGCSRFPATRRPSADRPRPAPAGAGRGAAVAAAAAAGRADAARGARVPAAEVAELLGMTTAAVNSALQRARAGSRQPGRPEGWPSPAAEQRAVVDRYVAAFERGRRAGAHRLLADDASWRCRRCRSGTSGPTPTPFHGAASSDPGAPAGEPARCRPTARPARRLRRPADRHLRSRSSTLDGGRVALGQRVRPDPGGLRVVFGLPTRAAMSSGTRSPVCIL